MTTATKRTARLVRGVQPEGDPARHRTLFGGDPSNPTWDEYIEGFGTEAVPYLQAVRECCEREGIVGTTGEQMANDHYFEFDDGSTLAFSWRAWGDLMSAIADKREGYMAYYM